MRKLLLLFSACSLLAISANSQRVDPDFQDGRIWFRLNADYTPLSSLQDNPTNLPLTHLPFLMDVMKDHQITKLSKPFWVAKTSAELQRTYLLEFDDIYSVDLMVKKLGELPYLDYAEKVPLDRHFLTPNDPSYGSQWGLNMIQAETAWNYFSTGSNIVIAIVDDAIETTHPDLAPNLWVNPGEIPGNGNDDDGNGYVDDINGWDVADDDNNPDPPTLSYDHGTHVAGISSSGSNNGTGVASIGFSCKLMCIKATNTPVAVTDGYPGIVYAAANGADVINMSWGSGTFTATGQSVIDYAWNQGCILVAAAGNDDVSSTFYPAGYTNVISVASTNSGDQKSGFSNYGSWIDISAPGSNIYSTTVNSSYGNKSGTSMASPMVAGLVGLMKSLNPGMTRTDLINCLYNSADDISSQNPSYPGQLGAGRINAANSMQCVSLTLNNPPVADFTANFTTVTEGGQVQFTDQSVYNPTTWQWTFAGGTPASFTGQNPPPVTYSTAGTYNVTLTVTNGNGNDTHTETNYITVNAAGGCLSVNLPIPAGWTLTQYYTGATVGQDGWVNGNNVFGDREKAMYFDMSAQPFNFMTQVWIGFGEAHSLNTNKIVGVKVYDGTSGSPGAQIGSTYNLTMGEIMNDVQNNLYTQIDFPTPITLPASRRFFVSVDLTNLQWGAGVFDTLSIVSNTVGQTTPSAIWDLNAAMAWQQYNTGTTWALDASLVIHPWLTNEPVNATFTQTATTICSGDPITFDATGSTYQDTLLWVFPGGTPTIVSEDPNPTIYFNQPGISNVIMYVIGGGCSELDSAEVTITIDPTPDVSVTSTVDPLCSGGSTNLSATGATTYAWSPPTGLSATTGANVTANPTSTTTYNVTGTLGSCVGNTSIEIEVLNPPTATMTSGMDTISCGDTIQFDGSASIDVIDYNWTFTNGTPSTSNGSGELVSYTIAGTQNIQMVVSNTCGSDTANYSIFVLNDCSTVGIDEEGQGVQAYYNPVTEQVIINFTNIPANGDYNLALMNTLGQVLDMKQIQVTAGTMQYQASIADFATGVYYFRVFNQQSQETIKFIKQ